MNANEEGRVILIDKPLHWTSADVVKKIRNQVHAKVGHAGTLDPLATGLLILCTGKFTKKINEYMLQEKEYTGTITLGSTTASFDLETLPENYREFSFVNTTLLSEVSKKFTGEIIQIPPIYSAIKKNGERSYDLARQGRAVTLEGRKVFIKEFEMQILQLPLVHFRVVCSTGTYIRSLANDIGQTLGCGAHLSSLCRTRIGIYKLDDALSPEAAISKIKTGS
ncbi:MAG TPA: tRNA pseudouridine(55) synthase TruB [Puia sp.]|jgi:tRNA pseudouridine55 synthase|nr:tRNA pseudouridine(55) synthase TruB [Puia sp.]